MHCIASTMTLTTVTAGPPATMTREEVCLLKTALATVVIKRRLQARRDEQMKVAAQEDDPNNAEQPVSEAISLCPWLPDSNLPSTTTSISSACSLQHLNAMFQLAVNCPQETQAKAIVAHMRAQLLAHLDDILLQQWLEAFKAFVKYLALAFGLSW
jgi:hypothetical protein